MSLENQLENLLQDLPEYIEDKDVISDFYDEIKGIQANIQAELKANNDRIAELEKQLLDAQQYIEQIEQKE